MAKSVSHINYYVNSIDVNDLRKSIKVVYPTAIESDRPNGIQVLPVPWRKGVRFGLTVKDQISSGGEADLGMPDGDDGSPTLDELTVDSVPNIRNMVSDVIMDGKLKKGQRGESIIICQLFTLDGYISTSLFNSKVS